MRSFQFLFGIALGLGCCGCDEKPTPTRLLVSRLKVFETDSPPRFEAECRNIGDDPAVVDEVRLHVLSKHLIFDEDDVRVLPERLDFEARLQGEGPNPTIRVDVPPGSMQLKGSLHWLLPNHPAPMLAIVQFEVVVYGHGTELARSKPLACVMQSRPNILDAVLDSPKTNAGDAKLILEVLREYEGATSAELDKVIEHLESVAAGTL